MKKIIMIVTNRYDPDVRVHKEAKYYLSKNGCEVEILCWDRENDYLNRESEIIDGIKIKRFFPYSKYGTGIKQLISFIKFIKEIKNYLKDKDYDYLHCHDLDGIIAGYFVKKDTSKIIFDMHEFYEINTRNRILKYVMRILVNYFQDKSDFILYVNKAQKNTISERNIKKLIYIPNYPELSNYVDVCKTESDKLRVSYIGAVRQYNELKNLMDACKDFKDVLVSIHGSGVHSQKLKSIEKQYNNVRVTGRYHFSELSRLYSECDVLYAVYPMDIDQNRIAEPVKFFEAIITKTPIIVDKRMEISKFIINNGLGFTVDSSNIEDIKNLIETLLKNRNTLKEKINNFNKLQNLYIWEEVVKRLDKIIG